MFIGMTDLENPLRNGKKPSKDQVGLAEALRTSEERDRCRRDRHSFFAIGFGWKKMNEDVNLSLVFPFNNCYIWCTQF